MKNILSIFALALFLSACGDCVVEPPESPPTTVVGAPAEPVVTPEPVTPPAPEPAAPPAPPTPVTPPAVPVTPPIQIACPQSSVGCGPSPTPLPPNRVVTTPTPTPICVRNNEPLVYIEPFWVDNCGNKYGQVVQ